MRLNCAWNGDTCSVSPWEWWDGGLCVVYVCGICVVLYHYGNELHVVAYHHCKKTKLYDKVYSIPVDYMGRKFLLLINTLSTLRQLIH